MAQVRHTILESWPAIKDDLKSFITDTDAWIISELKGAYEAGDWKKVEKILDVMEMVHNMSHDH